MASQLPLRYTTAVQLNANFSSEFLPSFPPSLLLNIKLEDQNKYIVSYLRTYYGTGIPFAVFVQLSWLISMEYCKQGLQWHT